MSKTTIERVRNIASHLHVLEDAQIQLYMDDAELEIPDSVLLSDYGEKAHRYLTVHLATIDIRRPQRENKLNLTTSYKSTDKDEKAISSTKYGKEYLRVLKKTQNDSTILYKLYN